MTRRQLLLYSAVFSIIVFFWAASKNYWWVAFAASLVFLWIPILYLGARLGLAVGNEIRVASRPLPNLEQISAFLEKEWGRTPTFEEIVTVRQLLASRKNQALVASGLSLGGLYLVGRYA